MHTASTTPSATADDFSRLSAFLDRAGADAMHIEMLDGFFAALISGPEPVPPREWLPEALGASFVFDDDAQAQDVLGLLMRHWNAVAVGLRQSLEGKRVYMPVLLEDAGGIARGNDWATGFLRGMRLRRDAWAELLHSDDDDGPLAMVMTLFYENNADPELRSAPIPDDKREETHLRLAADLALIYRHFEPHRQANARTAQTVQQRRVGPKIGRNDPCPCGSGKKSKQCCAKGQTLH